VCVSKREFECSHLARVAPSRLGHARVPRVNLAGVVVVAIVVVLVVIVVVIIIGVVAVGSNMYEVYSCWLPAVVSQSAVIGQHGPTRGKGHPQGRTRLGVACSDSSARALVLVQAHSIATIATIATASTTVATLLKTATTSKLTATS
jgi:hypothetical protein